MTGINRPPLGLQDLLESQNFGANPRELLLEVRPTLDMLGLLKWRGVSRQNSSNTGVTAINQNTQVDIPNNEIWETLAFAVTVTNSNAAGARATVQHRLRLLTAEDAGGTGLLNLTVGRSAVPTILDATATTVNYGGEVWFPSGTFFGPGTGFQGLIADLDLNGGTSVTLRVDVLFYRYKF